MTRQIFLIVIALVTGVVLARSHSACVFGVSVCEYDGKQYSEGQRFDAKDGCNTCVCSQGKVMCTLMACTHCTYDGKKHDDGASFAATDGCNTCTCNKGQVGCTKMNCNKTCTSKDTSKCGGGEFCAFDAGSCGRSEQRGQCKAKPLACDAQYDPVCGCDGKTYSNACNAETSGSSVDYKGICVTGSCSHLGHAYADGSTFPKGDGCNTCTCTNGKVGCTEKACPPPQECGGIQGAVCQNKAEMCILPNGSCKTAEAKGNCQIRPQTCPQSLDPVCGCDGKTYNNACAAHVANVQIDYTGKCKEVYKCTYDNKLYNDGESFPSSDGCNACTCREGKVMCTLLVCPQPCGGSGTAACPAGHYCNYNDGKCGEMNTKGICAPQPNMCDETNAQVCGCNNTTYQNACKAAAAGISVKSNGACTK
ncbi:hypothetical protein L6R29_07990 [Myxococcota bacterium]|nr:hypothetical protein [Myxococcota bacterium]